MAAKISEISYTKNTKSIKKPNLIKKNKRAHGPESLT